MMVSALRFEGLQLKLFTHLKSQNIDAQAKFDRRVGRNNGWNEMLDWKKQLDYGRHIGKVVTVEKASEEGEKKEDDSPGIGVTQQLFATTDFLDETEKWRRMRAWWTMPASNHQTCWLPARMMNKTRLRLRPCLIKTQPSELSLKSSRPRRRS